MNELANKTSTFFVTATTISTHTWLSHSRHAKNRSTRTGSDVGLYLQTFLMRFCAFFVILRGKSMASIPFRMMLYVFIGSDAENGGLKVEVPLQYQRKRHSGLSS